MRWPFPTAVGLIRVVHPFPSTLNAAATVVVASIAGGQAGTAVRLGVGMLGLQFAIGAANDFTDAEADVLAHASKPIPAGLISKPLSAWVATLAAGLGLLAAATVGVPALVVGTLGLADGVLYDIRFKGTPLGWVPFAAGVALLPVYAWWGAVGAVPPVFPGVVGLAFIAGTTLALANAHADIDRDRASSSVSVATYLGARRTLLVDAALLAVVQIVAVATTIWLAGAIPLLAVELLGCGLGWLGIGLAAVPDARARPLVWEAQGVGIVVLGAAWLAVLSAAGLLRA